MYISILKFSSAALSSKDILIEKLKFFFSFFSSKIMIEKIKINKETAKNTNTDQIIIKNKKAVKSNIEIKKNKQTITIAAAEIAAEVIAAATKEANTEMKKTTDFKFKKNINSFSFKTDDIFKFII